jgi:hypothetical protein
MNGIRSTHLLIGTAAMSLALIAGVVRAQEKVPPPPPPDGPGSQIVVRTFDGVGGDAAVRFMGFEAGIGGKIVTNAPFTATVSTEITRTLADGNKIDQTITGKIARDSQGRTRRDMTLPGAMLPLSESAAVPVAATGGPEPRAVFINDPVSGTTYILHPDSKTASEVPFRAMKWAQRPLVRAFRKDAGVPGREKFAGEVTTTDLGTQTINGVLAQGMRITRTIPAGRIGNEKPIVIVTERWYSPDLQTYVLRKTMNPLSGDTTFQLTNIQQGEPDSALFQVPSDYMVKQGRMFRFRQRRGAQAPNQQNQLPDQQD